MNKRVCDKKGLTKQEAQGALNFNSRIKNKSWKRRKECRYYHCPLCNMWHLSSKEERHSAKDTMLTFVDRWKKLIA